MGHFTPDLLGWEGSHSLSETQTERSRRFGPIRGHRRFSSVGTFGSDYRRIKTQTERSRRFGPIRGHRRFSSVGTFGSDYRRINPNILSKPNPNLLYKPKPSVGQNVWVYPSVVTHNYRRFGNLLFPRCLLHI
jgi:hypothetical protein